METTQNTKHVERENPSAWKKKAGGTKNLGLILILTFEPSKRRRR